MKKTANTEKKEPLEEKRTRCFWFSNRLDSSIEERSKYVERVERVVNEKVTIESYAYIIHNQDVVTPYDIETCKNGYYKESDIGTLKHAHIHVVCQLSTPLAIKYICQWFDLAPHMVCFQTKDDKKYKDPYLDNVRYLTHEFLPENMGKHIYPRDCVIMGGKRLNIYEEIDKKETINRKCPVILDKKEKMYYVEAVAEGKMTLRELKATIGIANYIKYEKEFKKAREHFVLYTKEMPKLRSVFYVDCVSSESREVGRGGMGKSVCTHALAKQFAKEYGADLNKDYNTLVQEGYIFDLGGEGVALQNYDGEPILVMNEMDGYAVFNVFGRRGTKELLDNFPTRQDMNIKYGSTVVMAKYIIINGIERYDKFIRSLAGLYGKYQEEDKDLTQYYRRFFACITITDEEHIRIAFNRGIVCNTDNFSESIVLDSILCNWKAIAQRLEGEARTCVESKIFAPIIEKQKEREQNNSFNKITDINDLTEEMMNYGMIEKSTSKDENNEKKMEYITNSFSSETYYMELSETEEMELLNKVMCGEKTT